MRNSMFSEEQVFTARKDHETGAALTGPPQAGGPQEGLRVAMAVAPQDMADGGPRDGEAFIASQIQRQTLGSQAGLVPGSYDPFLNDRRRPPGLAVGRFGAVAQSLP